MIYDPCLVFIRSFGLYINLKLLFTFGSCFSKVSFLPGSPCFIFIVYLSYRTLTILFLVHWVKIYYGFKRAVIVCIYFLQIVRMQ